MSESSHPWFAVRVKSRCEKGAATALRGKGYEDFLPLYQSRRRWSDRKKDLDLPLFPGYVFCRFDPIRRLPILTTPGVVGVVSFGKIPQPVEQVEIEAIRAIVRSGLPSQPWPFVRIGQRVRVERGALEGLEGILLNLKSRYRVVVSLTLLQRSVAVEIDRDFVHPSQ